MLWPIHSPRTYDVVHGHAIALMLPHVIRHNAEQVGPWYDELVHLTNGAAEGLSTDAGAEGLADFVIQLRTEAGLAGQLSAMGVERGRLPELAANAATQWTGQFNPRTMNEESLLGLYEEAF